MWSSSQSYSPPQWSPSSHITSSPWTITLLLCSINISSTFRTTMVHTNKQARNKTSAPLSKQERIAMSSSGWAEPPLVLLLRAVGTSWGPQVGINPSCIRSSFVFLQFGIKTFQASEQFSSRLHKFSCMDRKYLNKIKNYQLQTTGHHK